MAPRRSGLAIEEFQRHWRDVHGPLVGKFVGLRRNWQNHALLREGETLLSWPGFDACSEMDFADVASMELAFSLERYPPELRADSEHLIDKSMAAPMVARRVHLSGRIDPRRVRLLTFMRRGPGCTIDQLAAALRAVPTASGALARELYMSLPDAERMAGLCGFDAIDILWFESVQGAERHVTSAEAREHRCRLGTTVCGVERLIAQVHVVL